MTKLRYREAKWMLCGDLIGRGSARETYHCRANSSYVIKIETKGGSFQNVAEWDTWSWLNGGPMAKWLAPCEYISPCGLILMQRKVEPVRCGELPKRLPEFLCDLKPENFGMMDGRFVCCDYGNVGSALRRTSTKMTKAEWRL